MKYNCSFLSPKGNRTMFMPIALVCVLTCIAFTGFMTDTDDSEASVAGSGTCGGGVTWNLSLFTLDIGYDSTKVLEGETADGKMTSIPWNTMAGYPEEIQRVTVWKEVVQIMDGAFSECDNLWEIAVNANNGNYSSQDGVLFNKDKTEILHYPQAKTGIYTIPDTVTGVKANAFDNCTGLTDLIVKSDVSIEFNSTTEVSYNIWSDITDIETKVTSGSSNVTLNYMPLTAAVDPSEICGNGLKWKLEAGTLEITRYDITKDGKMTSIPWKDQRAEIKYLIINDGVTSIKESAFRDTKITEVTIPGSVKTVGNSAFAQCTEMKTATVSSGESTSGMFRDCSALEKVTFGKSVESIYDDDFDGCTSLREFIVDPGNTKYSSENGILFNKDKSELERCPQTKSGNLDVPDSVKTIGSSAFADCASLESVTMPSGLTEIGDWAFKRCTSLKTVNLNEGLKTIRSSAFAYCGAMKTIDIPRSVTELESSNEGMFFGCSSLTAINVESGNTEYCSEDGVLYNKDRTELIQYPRAKEGAYTVPATVTDIDYFALVGCTGLDAIYVAEGNTEFSSRNGALFDITGKTILAYPAGHSGFVIPEGTTKIDEYAFTCSPIRTLTIPASVIDIDGDAFDNCGKLTRIVVHTEAKIVLDLTTDNKTEVECTVYSDNADVKEKVTTNYSAVHLTYRPLSDFSDPEDNGPDNTLVYVGIAAVAAVIGILAFMFIRKH